MGLGAPVGPAEGKAIKILGWPELSGDEFLDDRYVSYWRKATGIGLLCGEPSGIICLDVDLDKVKDVDLLSVIEAEIPPIKSGKIGNPNRRPAQFFRFNGELPRKFKNIAVEILSTGNQTILPPSGHPTFDTYSWVGTPLFELSDIDELPCLPPSLIPFLNDLDHSMIGPAVSSPVGGRNNQLKAMCGAMFDKGKHVEAVAQELFLYDQTHHKPPLFSDASEFKNADAKWNALSFATSIFKSYLNSKQAKGETLPHLSSVESPVGGVTKPKEFKKNYEQLGFYYRHVFPKDDGGVKIVDVPQYKLMADFCFDQKNMCFDDAESLSFDGKKWTWFSKNSLAHFIVRHNEECIKPAHIDGFTKMIKATCLTSGIASKSSEGLINVNNGVIDVKSGELLPHSYEYLFKYCSPVDFSPFAECPLWDKFLLETFSSNLELIDLIQKMFGYIIIGGKPFLHRSFCLYGSGRNGKSTLLDVLKAVIGKDSYSTVSLAKLDKEFSIVALDGKLANIVEETPTEAINSEHFKNLVGGGEAQAAHKGFDEYKFPCNARFVFACNEMPNFLDRTTGLEDRLIVIPFERYIKEEDRDTEMSEKLLSELPGIFNWAIAGAKAIAKDRKLPRYQITMQTKEAYRQETDPLYAWFSEEIEITASPLRDVTSKELYEKYKNDAEDNGNKPYSKDKFGKRFKQILRDKCLERGVFFEDGLRTPGGKSRIYRVINLKNPVTAVPGSFSYLSQEKHNGFKD